jgi:hypothetical protein
VTPPSKPGSPRKAGSKDFGGITSPKNAVLNACTVKPFSRSAAFLLAGILFCVHLAHTGLACTVPVFRYALDRWAPDRFQLKAPAAHFQEEPLASQLRNLGSSSPINLEAASAPDIQEATLAFPNRQKDQTQPLWKGALTPESFQQLVDSPARKELFRRILAGDSAVWVLIESGNVALDDTAAELIQARLRFLQNAATLPPAAPNDDNDPSNRIGPGPELKIQLSLIRIRRDSPEENPFLHMIAGPKGLEALPKDQPAAAVVFGRGRVLGIWNDLSESTIEEATLFLLGACSCEVKNLNPGWDLLSSTAWDTELEKADADRLRPVSSQDAPPKKTESVMPQTVTFSPTEPTAPVAPATPATPATQPATLATSTPAATAAGADTPAAPQKAPESEEPKPAPSAPRPDSDQPTAKTTLASNKPSVALILSSVAILLAVFAGMRLRKKP